MKINELLEEKKTFEVVFKNGHHTRKQQFTHTSIVNCKVFTPAEIKRILKLDVQGVLNAEVVNDEGRTTIRVNRTK